MKKTFAKGPKRRQRHGPNYRYWAQLAHWSVEEGTALLLKIDPTALSNPEFREARIYEKFQNLRERATRAHEAGELQKVISPKDFMSWAHRKRIRIPAHLRTAAEREIEPAELEIRERHSLLTLVISMAVTKYRYDPDDLKSRATQQILDDVTRTGLKSNKTTVKKYLDEAASLLRRQR